MKVLAFAGSSSRKSINKKLAQHAAELTGAESVKVLDLNDYELPIYSEDKEAEIGHPELAKEFLAHIADADALVISLAEHNGSYTAAYKNLFDWCSRIEKKVFQSKSMILLSTSPGPGGASSVLAAANGSMPFFDGQVKGSFSLPSFYDNFDLETNTISNADLLEQLKKEVAKLS